MKNAANSPGRWDADKARVGATEFRARLQKGSSRRKGEKGKHMKKLILLAAIAVLSVTAFTGCETTEGAGKDIERAGEKIQDAAN